MGHETRLVIGIVTLLGIGGLVTVLAASFGLVEMNLLGGNRCYFLPNTEALTQAELEPIEVRFLRKLLEYTQADLAEHLGVDRATANRWEQDGGRLTGANSYALRSHVFMQLGKKAGPRCSRRPRSR